MTTTIPISSFNEDFIAQLNANFAALDTAADSVSFQVAGLTDLKALGTPFRTGVVLAQYRTTAGDGLGGTWIWRSGDMSANVSADPTELEWAAPADATTGASGAWQRHKVDLATGISGLGTGIATALATNAGSAGAPVLFNGAGGTPTSLTLTNATGLPLGAITGLGSGVATFLATPSSANLAAAVTGETGTGSLVFSANPTFTGTLSGASASFTGAVKGSATQGALQASNGGGTNGTSIYIDREGAAVDEKRWEVRQAGDGAFNIRAINDAYTLSSNGLTFTRGTGYAITAGTLTPPMTLSGALTYGGVTLSNSVTGTGSMVLSANPTFTGTLSGSIASFSGTVKGTGSQGALQASNGSGTGGTSIYLDRVDAAADEKRWEVRVASDGTFGIRAINDAYTLATNAVTFTRGTGYAITSGTITPPMTLSGTLTAATINASGILTGLSGTAIGAGANTQAWVKASSTAHLGIYYGTGAPSFSAAKGSLYSRTDATTTTTRLYVNTDGSTTWANFTASA